MPRTPLALRKQIVVGVALVACFILPAMPSAAVGSATQTSSAPSAQNKQIVAAAFDRWAAGGSTFFTDMLAPDVVWTIEGSGPSAGTFKGRGALLAAIKPFTRRLSSPIRPVSRRIWADGEHVIINWVGEATAKDGQRYRNQYAWIFRMANGKAVEVDAFLDLTPYDDVLRRIPEPAGPERR